MYKITVATVVVGLACLSLSSNAEPIGLFVARDGPGNIRLSWTNAAVNFVLEHSGQIGPEAVWSPVTQSLNATNGLLELSLSPGENAQFYRLRFVSSAVLPPDPSSVAPAPPRGVATIIGNNIEFLYSGTNAIQTGISAGILEAKRTAVLRGRVRTADGATLAGARLTVLGHPEFGHTLSRADGMFDLAVNGGGTLTVDYEETGFCPAHRQVKVPWQEYTLVPDVALVPMDPVVTAVTLGSNSTFQVAHSSIRTDSDGVRQMTLMFKPGTVAGLILPNGSTQAVDTLHIRATEFTVGTNGTAAMPAVLPPLSGYTYRVELSADEAMAAGATGVVFNQPVNTYVENFLNFPVGTQVPVGIYDRSQAAWLPSPNGRVIKILSVSSGQADIDSNGDGLPDGALSLSSDERLSLASSYSPGQSLWRVSVTHFSPEDSNWPYANPDDAVSPANSGAGPDPNEPLENPCESPGTIIECENQVLGDEIPIVGTPFTLNYRSDRVPGRAATRGIRLSGSTVPASLASIDLHLSIAGRQFDQSFPASPNLQTTFNWDRKDAYGRPMQGGQTLEVKIDYNYPMTYQQPGPFPAGFNQPGGPTLAANPGRQQIAMSDQFAVTIGEGLTDARSIGLGGWTLNVHNVYDPVARVMHGGNGGRRRAASLAAFSPRSMCRVAVSCST